MSHELDPIPTGLLKDCVDEIVSVMTRIINTSFSLGLFPRDLKNALVKPLLKKPSLDPNCLKNYRPVSNISFLSKVMEKIVSSQLIEHLAANDLLEPLQSAYRSGHSTETALLKVHDDIICAVGKKKAVLVVLLDLSAAFDTVEHSVLLDTLQSLGIDGSVLSWSESYLCDRSQQVTISGKKSEGRKLFCGVPQGSVLGPLLFTIYTSSLGKLLRDLDMPYHLYADDSQLYICFESSSPEDTVDTVERMEKCMSLVRKWMVTRLLKMNDEKTECLVISSGRLAFSIPVTQVQIGESAVSVSKSARNIGVIFYLTLSLKSHVNQVCRKSYFQLRNLGKLRQFFTQSSLEQLVHSFVTSQLDYCNSLFLGLPKSQVQQLQRIQNTAARIVSGRRKYDHITPVLYDLHWLPVDKRIEFKTLVLIFKCIHGIAPAYLSGLMKVRKSPRRLRSSDQFLLQVPFTRAGVVAERAFSVAGPRLWNALPSSIRLSESLDSFKGSLKT